MNIHKERSAQLIFATYFELGQNAAKFGNMPLAYRMYLQAEKLAEQLNHNMVAAAAAIQIADLLARSAPRSATLRFLRKRIARIECRSDSRGALSSLFIRLADFYLETNQKKLAKACLIHALHLLPAVFAGRRHNVQLKLAQVFTSENDYNAATYCILGLLPELKVASDCQLCLTRNDRSLKSQGLGATE